MIAIKTLEKQIPQITKKKGRLKKVYNDIELFESIRNDFTYKVNRVEDLDYLYSLILENNIAYIENLNTHIRNNKTKFLIDALGFNFIKEDYIDYIRTLAKQILNDVNRDYIKTITKATTIEKSLKQFKSNDYIIEAVEIEDIEFWIEKFKVIENRNLNFIYDMMDEDFFIIQARNKKFQVNNYLTYQTVLAIKLLNKVNKNCK